MTTDIQSPATASMEPQSFRSNGPTHASPGRARSVVRVLSGLLARCAAGCKDFFGPVEFSVSVRRGFLDGPCSICKRDVHDVGVMCPRQCSALCSGCSRVVMLDGYLQCAEHGGHHAIIKSTIHPTTATEWRRKTLRRVTCPR